MRSPAKQKKVSLKIKNEALNAKRLPNKEASPKADPWDQEGHHPEVFLFMLLCPPSANKVILGASNK
jgi:hypothetical protein